MAHPEIGFLYLGQTHTEYSDVSLSLAKLGIESHLIDLSQSDAINWAEYSLINVRECRGYHLDPDFLHKIEIIDNKLGNVPLTNSLTIIRAAIDKEKYLQQLEQDGVDSIPTFWLKRGTTVTLEDVIRETGWNDIVVKPTVSSKGWNTYRIVNGRDQLEIMKAGTQKPLILKKKTLESRQALAELLKSHDVCFQKFMPEILSRGELSFVFIDGEFSHAVRKTVAKDNWLAHEFFGGKNEYYKAAVVEINWAQDIYARLFSKYGDFLYARIDGIADGQKLRLLECELIAPRLFLREGHALEKYSVAIRKRIAV